MNFNLSKQKSFKRTPLRTVVSNMKSHSSTSRESFSSLYAFIGNKSVSLEEHNKVMFQNQRLAKENALLKSRLNEYKNSHFDICNEKLELKQHLSAANTHIQQLKTQLNNKKALQMSSISDKLKSAVNILMEDYLGVDSIKKQLNEFEVRVDSVHTIMTSLQNLIECNDESNVSHNLDDINDNLDQIWSTNSSMRRSLSSQEIDVRRRLSSERIQRDFHILSELSTIMEVSTEHRISSLSNGFDDINGTNSETPNVIPPQSVGALTNGMPLVNITNGSVSTATTEANNPKLETSIATKSSVNSKAISTKAKKVTKTTKTTKTKTKKKSEKQTESKTKANDSVLSIYDFNDDEANKENVIPLIPPQRHSKRIRSKRYSLSS